MNSRHSNLRAYSRREAASLSHTKFWVGSHFVSPDTLTKLVIRMYLVSPRNALCASAEARVDEDRLGPAVNGQVPRVHLAVERHVAGMEELEEEMPAPRKRSAASSLSAWSRTRKWRGVPAIRLAVQVRLADFPNRQRLSKLLSLLLWFRHRRRRARGGRN
jgi:hypothetical protein